MKQTAPVVRPGCLHVCLMAMLTLAALQVIPREAKAQFYCPPVVFDASRNVALVDQLANMVDQLRELKLRTSQLDQDLLQLDGWVGISSQELTLDPSLKMDGLSYRSSGIAGDLQSVMPGYQTWTDYTAELAQDYNEVLLTFRSIMEALHEHDATITDYQRLDDLRASAQSTEGNLQALQNGNEIEVYLAAQLQSLRQQIAALVNLKAVHRSHEVNDRARRAAASLKTSQDLLDCFHGSGACQ